eukprot:851952-Rhodomonas_salina.3
MRPAASCCIHMHAHRRYTDAFVQQRVVVDTDIRIHTAASCRWCRRRGSSSRRRPREAEHARSRSSRETTASADPAKVVSATISQYSHRLLGAHDISGLRIAY